MVADWKLCTDEKEKYQAYLCSREWWSLRNQVIERCGGVCERCKIRKVDHVHHLTYIRKYAEKLTDLLGVCKKCHDGIHQLNTARPTPKPRKQIFSPIESELIEIMTLSPSVVPLVIERFGKSYFLSDDAVNIFRAYKHAVDFNCDVSFAAVFESMEDSLTKMRFAALHRIAREKLAFTKETIERRLEAITERLDLLQKQSDFNMRPSNIERLSQNNRSRQEMDSLLQQVLNVARNR